MPGITGEFAAVVENFEKNIYTALAEASTRLSKYNTLKMVFSSYSNYSAEILRGFKNFCHDFAFPYKIVDNINEESIQNGEVYINVLKDELFFLLEKVVASGFIIGHDVGVISYDETPLKKFILNGMTTIPTNFSEMGIAAAQSLMSNSKVFLEMPFKLILRQSL